MSQSDPGVPGVQRLAADRWRWVGERGGRAWRVEVWLEGDQLCVEDGPADESARRHEAGGGGQAVRDFLRRPASWADDFPELHATLRADLAPGAPGA